MRTIAIGGLAAVLAAGVALWADQQAEAPKPGEMTMKMPEPTKEHQWLGQFVGEWETESRMFMKPGEPPMTCKGTETVRALGGFWVVCEYKGDFQGKEFTGMFTLGYAPDKMKYVGTWVDSMNSHMWLSEGTVDSTGKVLTLESEGPCPMEPGKTVKTRDILEIRDKDHRVLTGKRLGDDGKWMTMMVVEYQRVAPAPKAAAVQ